MPTLTVIIPTFNEEQFIADALYSVKFADAVIVVDSFSTDKTVTIARDYGAIVLQRKFDNFSNQKNFALKEVKTDWILFLDADERITYKLRMQIEAAMKMGNHTGYKLNFPHFYMNRFLYHHDNDVTRLVKNGKCQFEGDVHEKLVVDGSIGKLKAPVLHFTYTNLQQYISKKDAYAWFQARQLQRKKKKVTYFHLAFKPFYRFFSSYIIKGGFLDGIPGLAVASVNAYGVFSRYAKLLLLE
ncbi:MAG: glycosyltransferase family 2 protein, partial [Bacteroidota bacterium]